MPFMSEMNEARTETINAEGPRSKLRGPSAYCPVRAMTEDTRFELVRGCPQHAFQFCLALFGGDRTLADLLLSLLPP